MSRAQSITVTTGVGGEFVTGTFTVGQLIPCALSAPISCNVIKRVPTTGNFATLTLAVTVPLILSNPNALTETVTTTVTFTQTVTLCDPEGATVDCSASTLMSCNCIVAVVGVGTITVSCEIEVCLVVNTIYRVQLLVSSYGFCVPSPCTVAPGICLPMPPEQCY